MHPALGCGNRGPGRLAWIQIWSKESFEHKNTMSTTTNPNKRSNMKCKYNAKAIELFANTAPRAKVFLCGVWGWIFVKRVSAFRFRCASYLEMPCRLDSKCVGSHLSLLLLVTVSNLISNASAILTRHSACELSYHGKCFYSDTSKECRGMFVAPEFVRKCCWEQWRRPSKHVL